MSKNLNPARIVLPRLGQPRFLGPEETVLSVTVALRAQKRLEAEFQEGFSLREVGHRRESLPLTFLDFSRVDPDEMGTTPSFKRGWRFFRAQLAIPAGAAPKMASRRFRLFDLHHPLTGSAAHSVVILAHDYEELVVLFAADLHVAYAWERLEEQIRSLETERKLYVTENLTDPARFFSRESFRENFVNPNHNLAALISTANLFAQRQQLDVIIFGGDLVDYVYRHFKGVDKDSYESTNFHLFESLILGRHGSGEELEVPILTCTGNHDYRLYPYKIETYGLQHCGLHHYQTKFLMKARRTPRLGIPTLRDLQAVVARTGRHHSLKYYFDFINPSLNYRINLGGLSLILLDTGRDVWLDCLRVHPRRWGNLVRSTRYDLNDPFSEGLHEDQLALLRRWIEDSDANGDVILVFHAGIFNPSGKDGSNTPGSTSAEQGSNKDVEVTPDRVDLNPYLSMPDTLGSRLALEKDLGRRSLNVSCIFQNQLPILKAAQRQRLLGLSGHIHRRVQCKMKRREAILEISGEPERGVDFGDGSLFCSAAALGHVQTKYSVPYRPGFYLLKCKTGRIKRVEWQDLMEYPLEGMQFWLSVRNAGQSRARLKAQINVVSEELRRSIDELRLIITFVFFEERKKAGPSVGIEIEDKAALLYEQQRVLDADSASRFFEPTKLVTVYSYATKLRRELYFTVASDREFRRTDELLGIAEIAREKDGIWETLRSSWHPKSSRLLAGI